MLLLVPDDGVLAAAGHKHHKGRVFVGQQEAALAQVQQRHIGSSLKALLVVRLGWPGIKHKGLPWSCTIDPAQLVQAALQAAGRVLLHQLSPKPAARPQHHLQQLL
jgi:hypothetical protein